MAAIIGHVLPLALGVALSSVPIVVMVLMLLSPRGRGSSITYLIGAFIGLTVLTALFTSIASLLPAPSGPGGPSPLFGTIEIALGAALLALAVVRWIRHSHRRRAAVAAASSSSTASAPSTATAASSTASSTATADAVELATPPAWMTRLAALGPIPSFGVGFVLMLRPKNLLLTVTAGVAIAGGNVSFEEDVVAIAVFVLLGISTLAAPILFALVAPHRTTAALHELRDWIARNSATVTTVVMLVLGTVIIGSGLTRL
jgi:hypothetical protein